MKIIITLVAAGCLVAAALAQQPKPGDVPGQEAVRPRSSEPGTASPPPAKYPALPSETPDKFEPATDNFDYVKRDVMIPMRDGGKLHTIILVTTGAGAAP